MPRSRFFLVLLSAALLLSASDSEPSRKRPVATYSIVTRDPTTGQLGVAVQSHLFSVGSLVTWARAGVGAMATQSFVLVDYGPDGLELMAAGVTAEVALERLDRTGDSYDLFREIFSKEKNWRTLLSRLPASGLMQEKDVRAVLNRVR